jgi:hypothetical protein
MILRMGLRIAEDKNALRKVLLTLLTLSARPTLFENLRPQRHLKEVISRESPEASPLQISLPRTDKTARFM